MASKSNMTLRIEPELKEQAAALFKSLGLKFEQMKNRMRSLMRRWKQRKTVKICTALLIALQK